MLLLIQHRPTYQSRGCFLYVVDAPYFLSIAFQIFESRVEVYRFFKYHKILPSWHTKLRFDMLNYQPSVYTVPVLMVSTQQPNDHLHSKFWWEQPSMCLPPQWICRISLPLHRPAWACEFLPLGGRWLWFHVLQMLDVGFLLTARLFYSASRGTFWLGCHALTGVSLPWGN